MHQTHILCINPWIHDFAVYDLWVRPLGLLSIAATLRERGYAVELIDCLDRARPDLLAHQGLASPDLDRYGTGAYYREIIDKPTCLRDVPRYFRRYGLPTGCFDEALRRVTPPDAVLVTSKMTYWYRGVQEAIEHVRRIHPGVPILLGGTYATLCPEHAKVHSGADHIITGEGELATLRWLEERFGPPTADLLPDEFAYPIPAHDLVYGREAAALLTTRGCPLHCTYCASFLVSPGFRRYPATRVLAEIDFCFELCARHFAFYDDALLMAPERHIHPILDGIIERGYPVDFHTPNAVHASCIDFDLARKLYRAGFCTVRMGLETSDPERQDSTGGKVSNERFEQAVRALRRAGFNASHLAAYVLTGLPGQPLTEVAQTVEFVQRQGAQAKLAFYSPIPGTPMWEQAVEQGLIAADADPLLHNNTLVPLRTGISWQEFERFKRWVHVGNARLTRPPDVKRLTCAGSTC